MYKVGNPNNNPNRLTISTIEGIVLPNGLFNLDLLQVLLKVAFLT